MRCAFEFTNLILLAPDRSEVAELCTAAECEAAENETISMTQQSGKSEIPAWYALVTKSRHEKRVSARLNQKGIVHYLPLRTRVRQWCDRRRRIEEPLFRCYLFVHIVLKNRFDVLQTDGAVRLVEFDGAPARIRDFEIEAIKKYLKQDPDPEIVPYIAEGTPVTITRGPFAGYSGVMEHHRGVKRVLVSIAAIRHSLPLEIEATDLEQCETNMNRAAR